MSTEELDAFLDRDAAARAALEVWRADVDPDEPAVDRDEALDRNLRAR